MNNEDKQYLKKLDNLEPKYSDEVFNNLVKIMTNVQQEEETIREEENEI